MDFSIAGFSVLHYLPQFAQTHVHWVHDAIYFILWHPLFLLLSIFPSVLTADILTFNKINFGSKKSCISFFFFFFDYAASLLQHEGFLQLWLVGFSSHSVSSRVWASLVSVGGLSCPVAWGILVPQPGIKPLPLALEDGFLTTWPPGKSQKAVSEVKVFSGFVCVCVCVCVCVFTVENSCHPL